MLLVALAVDVVIAMVVVALVVPRPKWFQEIGYPDGFSKPSGYPIS